MESIWRDAVQMPSFPKLEGTKQTDVLIIGGGLAGVLTAHYLMQAGIDCLLLEANTVGSGVTGNTTAKVTAQHGLIYHKLRTTAGLDAARLYYQTQQAAVDAYRALSQHISFGFEPADAWIYSGTDRAALERECEAYAAMGVSATLEERTPLPVRTVGAVRLAGQGQFHPLRLLAALAGPLHIYEHTRVQRVRGRTAYTACGSVQAEKIVVTTHFPFLDRHGWYFLKQYQQRSYVLALRGAAPVEGMYLEVAPGGLSFRSYGEYLLLGGGGHRTGCTGSGWDGLYRFARQTYRKAQVCAQWAAQDCMSLDGMPYIGPYGGWARDWYVATGFNKWGMSNAMAAALLLRDLLQGKSPAVAALFSPQRRLYWPQLGKNVGAAAAGLLRRAPRRCAHMGCALAWDPYEHCWACSCHGSRFSADRRVLDGPANRDIRP